MSRDDDARRSKRSGVFLADEGVPSFIRLPARAGSSVAALAIVLMAISMLRELIGRFFFQSPTAWASELTGILMIPVVFLGASYTLHINQMIRVTVVTDRLPGRARSVADAIASAVALAVVGFLTWHATFLALDTHSRGTRSATTLAFAVYQVQALIALGLLMLTVAYAVTFVSQVRRAVRHEDIEPPAEPSDELIGP